MARTTLAERYARLETRHDELVAMGIARQPTQVHIQTVRVLKDLLTMGREYSTGNVPAALRTVMRTLEKMEPVLVDELAAVPPEQITTFMAALAERINSIVEAAGGAGDDQRADQSRTAQPETA